MNRAVLMLQPSPEADVGIGRNGKQSVPTDNVLFLCRNSRELSSPWKKETAEEA